MPEDIPSGKTDPVGMGEVGKLRNVVRAVGLVHKAATKFQSTIQKDLWPTEEALMKEGLLYERGGTHPKDWDKVQETIRKFRANPEVYMSTVDTSKHCRAISILVYTQHPMWTKLMQLKQRHVAVETYVDLLKKSASNSAKRNDMDPFSIVSEPDSDLLEESDVAGQLLAMQKQIMTISRQGGEPSIKSTSSLSGAPWISNRLNRTSEALSKLKELMAQRQDAEDQYIQMLDRLLENSDARETGQGCSFLPCGPLGRTPLQLCFMLGLKSTAVRLVERFYNTPELLSTPTQNDIDPWRIKGGIPQWEDGMNTGETVLHNAIVMEDTDLVQYLVERGIDLSSRASGAFFQPPTVPRRAQDLSPSERRRAAAAGIDLGEDKYVPFALRRNEISGCYYGEFPLSFAASIGSFEICELLYNAKRKRLADRAARPSPTEEAEKARQVSRRLRIASFVRDAAAAAAAAAAAEAALGLGGEGIPPSPQVSDLRLFVNAVDMFGNTALHLAALHGRRDVIDWVMSKEEGGEGLEMVNLDGFTPYTLAVRHGSVAVAQHMLVTYLSKVAWTYGRVRLRQTDLLQVDTFRVKGHPLHEQRNWRSALEIVVAHEVAAMAEDPLINRLVQDKWCKFGRRLYLKFIFVPYSILLALFAVTASLRGVEVRDDWADLHRNGTASAAAEAAAARCAWNLADGMGGGAAAIPPRRVAVLVMQAVLAIVGCPWLLYKGYRQQRSTMGDLDEDLDGKISLEEAMDFVLKNGGPLLDVAGGLLLLTAAILRTTCADQAELGVTAAASVVLFCNFLNALTPFRFFGGLMTTVGRMLRGDIARFLVVYSVIHCGFAFARFLLLQRGSFYNSDGDDPGGFLESFLSPFWVALGDDLAGIMDYYQRSEMPGYTLALYLVWVVMSNVVLLNLLIAMLARTFTVCEEDVQALWFFPFADFVLRLENTLSPADRRRFRSGQFRAGNSSGPGKAGENLSDRYVVLDIAEVRDDNAAEGLGVRRRGGGGQRDGVAEAVRGAVEAMRADAREAEGRLVSELRGGLRGVQDRVAADILAVQRRLGAVGEALGLVAPSVAAAAAASMADLTSMRGTASMRGGGRGSAGYAAASATPPKTAVATSESRSQNQSAAQDSSPSGNDAPLILTGLVTQRRAGHPAGSEEVSTDGGQVSMWPRNATGDSDAGEICEGATLLTPRGGADGRSDAEVGGDQWPVPGRAEAVSDTSVS